MWLTLLLVIAAYVALHAYVRRHDGWLGLSATGILLLWRTQRGRQAFAALARPQRAWRALGDVGIAAVVLTAVVVISILVVRALSAMQGEGVPVPSPAGLRGAIGLPGINPIIPLGYGLAALIIAIIVHEGGHAVMAYAHGMRVKSSGILLLGLPVGAFIEPEPSDVHAASLRAKDRILAAGPAANLALALVSMLLLSALLTNGLTVAADGDGVGITEVTPGSPAETLGLTPGAAILGVNGEPTPTNEALQDALSNARPGDEITLEWSKSGEIDRGSAKLAASPTNATRPMLGVRTIELRYLAGLHHILARPMDDGIDSFRAPTRESAPGSMLLYLVYPTLTFANGINVLGGEHARFLEPQGALAALPVPVLAGVATMLYWLAWTNLMLATFNVLPIGPLDGGQMVRNTIRSLSIARARIPAYAIAPPTGSDDDLSPTAPEYAKPLDRIARRTRVAVQITTGLTIALLLAPAVFARVGHLA